MEIKYRPERLVFSSTRGVIITPSKEIAHSLGVEYQVSNLMKADVVYCDKENLQEKISPLLCRPFFVLYNGMDEMDLWFHRFADLIAENYKASVYYLSEAKELIDWYQYTPPVTHEIIEQERPDGDDGDPWDFFLILGHDEGRYYFFPKDSGQIVEMTPSAMGNMVNLFKLAPFHYWKQRYGDPENNLKSKGIAEAATGNLIDLCHKKGIFKAENIRGIGIWRDKDITVFHCGGFLQIEGKKIKAHSFDSQYVYPSRPGKIDIINSVPLDNKEASQLRELCGRLSWENKLSGDLLAGWCVVAPICAALNWRPHIWITGQSESGKSTVMNKIINPIVGNLAIRVDGRTTEAGIRGTLKCDGRPIILDEAEAESIKDTTIMEGVLALARLSSSGAKIIKGTSTGGSVEYTARSAFCFSGINPSVKHRADESRISQLVLQRDESSDRLEKYIKLKNDLNKIITKDFSERLLARTIKNMDTLLENIEIFSSAASEVLCNQRASDQIGPMLAGLFLLTSENRITKDAAVAWIKKHDWTMHTAIAEQTDPQRLISKLSASTIRYKIGDEKITEDTIGYLIGYAKSGNLFAERALRNYGIWPKPEGVCIANNSVKIREILQGTPWHKWNRTLGDIDGATHKTPSQFAPGINSRSVCVPYSIFGIEDYIQEEEMPF